MEQLATWLQAQPDFWKWMFLIVAAQFVILALIVVEPVSTAVRLVINESRRKLGLKPKTKRRRRRR